MQPRPSRGGHLGGHEGFREVLEKKGEERQAPQAWTEEGVCVCVWVGGGVGRGRACQSRGNQRRGRHYLGDKQNSAEPIARGVPFPSPHPPQPPSRPPALSTLSLPLLCLCNTPPPRPWPTTYHLVFFSRQVMHARRTTVERLR